MTQTNTAVKIETVEEKLARLERENAALREQATKGRTMRLKISQSGGLSVYGMGRFPVTLYKEQWERLIAEIPVISKFLVDHASELKTKE